MASYATVAQFKRYLKQLATVTDATVLADIQDVLDRATDIVDLALGFSFVAYGAAAARDLRALGGDVWDIAPPHEIASVASVYEITSKGTTYESTSEITDYEELEDGRLFRGAGWAPGAWYRITAEWGYGPAPAAIVEVTLEVAVNIWRSSDRGQFSDVIGVEGGGAVGYQRALTNQQRMIIDQVRMRVLGGPGVA